MSKRIEPYPAATPLGGAHVHSDATLPFEAEFDGSRRPSQPADELCDPQRYWDIFSGTD